MFFEIERREFSEQANRYFISSLSGFSGGREATNSTMNFVVAADLCIKSIFVLKNTEVSKLPAPDSYIRKVLRIGRDAKVRPSIVQGVVVDVVYHYALGGIHDKSMEVKVAIWRPRLSVDQRLVCALAFLRSPTARQDTFCVLVINEGIVSLSEWNDNGHRSNTGKPPVPPPNQPASTRDENDFADGADRAVGAVGDLFVLVPLEIQENDLASASRWGRSGCDAGSVRNQNNHSRANGQTATVTAQRLGSDTNSDIGTSPANKKLPPCTG